MIFVLCRRYCFTFLTYTKDKSIEIDASSVNFESFSEDFTLYSKYRRSKNFYLQDVISQKMNHEKHPQRIILIKTFTTCTRSFNQFLLFHMSM